MQLGNYADIVIILVATVLGYLVKRQITLFERDLNSFKKELVDANNRQDGHCLKREHKVDNEVAKVQTNVDNLMDKSNKDDAELKKEMVKVVRSIQHLFDKLDKLTTLITVIMLSEEKVDKKIIRELIDAVKNA